MLWKRCFEFDMNGEALPDEDDDGVVVEPLKHQSCGRCVVDLSAIMMSLIKNLKDEHGFCEIVSSLFYVVASATIGIPASIVDFQRISLIGFRSCASRSQTGASESRQSTE
ncbi:hypothetical protein Tco_0915437 [Tanacetum coccineum]